MTATVLAKGHASAIGSTTPEKVSRIGKSRVQLDLSARAMAQLAELKDKTDAASYAEVFKNAMKLYDGIISEIEQGATFLIRDKDGKVSEFRMFL
jgi:hypothetical protein